jgi:hypothetical protein
MVYLKASLSLRVLQMLATVDLFWPIAT